MNDHSLLFFKFQHTRIVVVYLIRSNRFPFPCEQSIPIKQTHPTVAVCFLFLFQYMIYVFYYHFIYGKRIIVNNNTKHWTRRRRSVLRPYLTQEKNEENDWNGRYPRLPVNNVFHDHGVGGYPQIDVRKTSSVLYAFSRGRSCNVQGMNTKVCNQTIKM